MLKPYKAIMGAATIVMFTGSPLGVITAAATKRA